MRVNEENGNICEEQQSEKFNGFQGMIFIRTFIV